MIHYLSINNFTIIDQVELELESGLTVLTGETGAGKSILVDALGLALGDRADSSAVRAGCERAEVCVVVDLEHQPEVREWLEEQSLAAGDECVIRRVISAEGRSRAYVNDRPAALASLRELGSRLVDIHGQQAHLSLTRPAAQRRLLDFHGGLHGQAAAVHAAFQAWQQAQRALQHAAQQGRDHEMQRELLEFQVGELEALALEPGEYRRLCEENDRLAHRGRLVEGAQLALGALYEGDQTVQSTLARTARSLEQLAALDAALGPACELLRDAEVQVTEAAQELRRCLDALDMDPQRAAAIEERLHGARELARKHRVEADHLHELLPQLSERLSQLEQGEGRREQLAQQARHSEAQYLQLAEALHAARCEAAAALSVQVTDAMRTLGMAEGSFRVAVQRLEDQPRAHGLDDVVFEVSANPGHPAGPLARVASGGELSRIALAIQVVAAGGSPIPCLVFDEVDAGVGGRVAEIVGRRLRELGRERQVLCVTHLPQVASQGHHHLRVEKRVKAGTTHTVITPLEGSHKVEELARMLGGIDITERTRAHAEEMLAAAATD